MEEHARCIIESAEVTVSDNYDFDNQDILTGAAKISLAGGVENMSQSPFAVRGVRFGTVLGTSYVFEDTLWAGLTDTYCGLPMGMTAEKLGSQFGITKDVVDNFALKSQQRWKKGN